jgi:hypothetical protein
MPQTGTNMLPTHLFYKQCTIINAIDVRTMTICLQRDTSHA